MLAAGLLVVFVVVLVTPATASYFSLLRPGGPELPVALLASVLWLFVLRACWRRAVLERLLGLPVPGASAADGR